MNGRFRWDGGDVSGVWDRPTDDPRAVLVLAHGAGGDMNDSLLRAVASDLCARGVAVVRFNFPYREAGRKAPGSQAQSEACYRAVANEARIDGVPLFCGGKSYGGRMATHIASDGFAMDGLVLLSYPLHPPGRPGTLRDQHLARINAPMLVVQGTKDPFATPSLLEETVSSVPGMQLIPIDGGDHSLRVKGRKASDVVAQITDAVDAFIRAAS